MWGTKQMQREWKNRATERTSKKITCRLRHLSVLCIFHRDFSTNKHRHFFNRLLLSFHCGGWKTKCWGLAHRDDLLEHEGSLSSCLAQLPAQLVVLVLQCTIPFQQLANVLRWLWPVKMRRRNHRDPSLCVKGTLGCIHLKQCWNLLKNVSYPESAGATPPRAWSSITCSSWT